MPMNSFPRRTFLPCSFWVQSKPHFHPLIIRFYPKAGSSIQINLSLLSLENSSGCLVVCIEEMVFISGGVYCCDKPARSRQLIGERPSAIRGLESIMQGRGSRQAWWVEQKVKNSNLKPQSSKTKESEHQEWHKDLEHEDQPPVAYFFQQGHTS